MTAYADYAENETVNHILPGCLALVGLKVQYFGVPYLMASDLMQNYLRQKSAFKAEKKRFFFLREGNDCGIRDFETIVSYI